MAAKAFGQKSLCLLAVIFLSVFAASGLMLPTASRAGLGPGMAAAATLPASGLPASFIPSFDMSIHGLGHASFYTFQQALPRPTLPYATQDEWVQYAYPDGSSAVYNVALMSPLNRVVGCTNGCLARAAASQPYVAVKAGDIAELAERFYVHFTGSMAAEEHKKAEQLLLHDQVDTVRILQHAQDSRTLNGFDLPTPVAMTAAQPTTCAYRTFQLYLGMSIPLTSGGGLVSQQQLEAFLQAEVSPRVPGFTVLSGTGFWEGEHEPVAVLEVVSSGTGIAKAVMEIAVVYKRLFGQEAVLLKEAACPAAVQLV